MSENGEGPSDLSRREFLKLGAAVAGGAIANEAARKYGILEKIGNFFSKKVEDDNIVQKMSQEEQLKIKQRDAKQQIPQK